MIDAEAREPDHLSYIGARVIRERFKKQHPGLRLPSLSRSQFCPVKG